MKNNKIVIANWKMFGSFDFIFDFFSKISLINIQTNIKIILCPPYPFINICRRLSAENNLESTIDVGGQNISHLTNNSSTGEIDANILQEIGANYCIVGHTERRELGETNEDINQKIKILSTTNIIPILCIGEKKDDYENKNTIKVLKEQISLALKDIKKIPCLYVAYEPVWAIGTGKIPSKEEIENIMIDIIKSVNSICDIKELKVFYGGSINKDNMQEILNYKSINGIMIGGFSRKTDEFCDALEKINIK